MLYRCRSILQCLREILPSQKKPKSSDDSVEGRSAPLHIFIFSYLSWGWANDPAVYTDCTMLNTQRGHKIYYFTQAINNSPWCLPRCHAERIKSAGTAKEMPVSDKPCKSQDFYTSQGILSLLFVTLQKEKKLRKHQHFIKAIM